MDYSANGKDYKGAQKIVAYFSDGEFSPKAIALVFGQHGRSTEMMAVFQSDLWTRESVILWKRAIAAHEKHRKTTRSKRATEGTEIRKPEKKVKKFSTKLTKKA